MNLSWTLALVLVLELTAVHGIMFHLQPDSHKCLKEELRKNQLILGEFDVQHAPGQRVNYVVRDSKGDILSQSDDIGKGRFTAIVEADDIYEICFTSKVMAHQRGVAQEVMYVAKRDHEGKPLENLQEAEKMKPMETDLRNLELLSQSIVDDFKDMRVREVKMSDTNESTNNRVLYLSVFSMCCLLCLSVWQVLYLRKFFKSRKLIE